LRERNGINNDRSNVMLWTKMRQAPAKESRRWAANREVIGTEAEAKVRVAVDVDGAAVVAEAVAADARLRRAHLDRVLQRI